MNRLEMPIVCSFSAPDLLIALIVVSLQVSLSSAAESARCPFDQQVAEQVVNLNSTVPSVRAGAAEALAYYRAYTAANALAKALRDESPLVRREAAMSLAWCGGRSEVGALLDALDDRDWVVRQAAWVSLTNLTGMEWPFDALANRDTRDAQASAWRRWWSETPKDQLPSEVLALVESDKVESRLRGARALGSLGGDGAVEVVMRMLDSLRQCEYRDLNSEERHLGQSCIRSLGRLRDHNTLPVLIELLETPGWARYAADALGDFDNREAVGPLIAAYPKFSRHLDNRTRNPEICPADDRYSGDNTQDRMHETPYMIALALSRLPLDDPVDLAKLKGITPHLVSNLPSDWDGGVLYQPEAFEHATFYLLEKAGTRRMVCEAAFQAASESDEWLDGKADTSIPDGATLEETLSKLARKMRGDVPYMAAWLPALCRDASDVSRLIGLLEHDNGWISINATKALMFLDATEAITPIARLLAESQPEAEYGFSGVLEHAEYNDPAPRRREAFIRALGHLDAVEQDKLLIGILEDQRNVVEMQHAVARALDQLGTPAGIEALKRADHGHPFHSVRMIAREGLWRRGLAERVSRTATEQREPLPTSHPIDGQETDSAEPDTIVFIEGDNDNGSDFNGQAGVDPWRQTGLDCNSGIKTRSVSEEEAVVRWIPRLRFGLLCCHCWQLPEL